jgi:beta-ribofuranosylaminobenzene 5'-phosphate synthase
LIVEAGKLRAGKEVEIASPMVERVELPGEWRFVLVVPRGEQGLWGPDEEAAFGRLPPVPPETTENLLREAHAELLPAAREGDFDRFADSVYRFGKLAGTCFATAQHGCFASPAVEERIEWLRAKGVRGAAQSSWGPTVLAVLPSEEQAETTARQIAERADAGEFDIVVTAPNNRGAVIETSPSP